jgi:hypothetical protein
VKPDSIAEHSCSYEDDSDHGKDNDYLPRPYRLRKLLATKMSLLILDLLLFPSGQVFEHWELATNRDFSASESAYIVENMLSLRIQRFYPLFALLQLANTLLR